MDWSLVHIAPSRWFIVGLVFALLAIFSSKRIPLLICSSAILTGITGVFFSFLHTEPLSTPLQISVFLVLLLLGLLLIRVSGVLSGSILRKNDVFVLTTPIKQGRGGHVVGGNAYTLIGPDCPVQTKMIVISMKGMTAYVTPVEKDD